MAKAKKIKGAPNKMVTGLCAPYVSSGTTLSASWAVPSNMIANSNAYRATSLKVDWTISMEKTPNVLSNSYDTSTTSAELDISNFKIGGTTYSRSSFYPVNLNNKLTAVSVSVTGQNTYGKKKNVGTGQAVTQTKQFAKPDKPTIDSISLNSTNGVVSTTISADAGTVDNERYDTAYTRTVYRSANNSTLTYNATSTSSEINVSYDVADYAQLGDDDYIKVTWTARNRGYAGDSDPAESNIYLAYPAKTIIKGVDATGDSTGNGRVTVEIDVNTKNNPTHPVYGVKLEYAKNTTYTKASDIPANAWAESGAEDNANCTALTMARSLFEEERGKHSWVRVKSYGADESVLYKYSDPVEVKALYVEAPAATQANIKIISAVSGADGESAVVTLGWNANGSDEYTGTELSWSDDENTWRSTKEPEIHEFTWTDGRYPATGTLQYNDSATITIMDLKRDTKYWIKARRYLEGETTTYGRYSDAMVVVPTNEPSSVVARCEKTIAAGEPLGVYWTFGGGGLQTKWRIEAYGGGNIVDGDGSFGFAQISANRLAEKAVNNVVKFRVWVTTGGGEKESEWNEVTILQKPTLSISASSTLTSNALSFTASSSRVCKLVVIVTSQGVSGQTPQGFKAQMAGDTVYSDELENVAWSNGSATVNLPTGLDFWDGGRYTLSVTAIDKESKLRSNTVTKEFTVNWTNKAIYPYSSIALTPIDQAAESGNHIQGVQIDLTPPTGSRTGDVYDIYRMDGSNAHLIGKGVPLTYTVTDEYAPFGGKAMAVDSTVEGYANMAPTEEGWYEYQNGIYVPSADDDVSLSKTYFTVEPLFYRIAYRTVDGDVAFADKEYAYPYEGVRFDWHGGSLELPYGVSIGDSYKKSVEFRQHMDGSTDGYWNKNIERKGSYGSSIIKLVQPDHVNMARALGRYAGAVFVRTDNGSAYAADVQVNDLSVKNEAVTVISVDTTEVGLTDEFRLASPYEQEEEE